VLDESNPSSGDRMMGLAGLERDTDTGLNLAVFREENPATGRWDSQDPIGYLGGDRDLYRYVRNRPTGATDSDGLGEFLNDYLYYLNPLNARNPNWGSPGWQAGKIGADVTGAAAIITIVVLKLRGGASSPGGANVGRMLIRSGTETAGKLEQVTTGINETFYRIRPKDVEESFSLVKMVVEKCRLEPGRILNMQEYMSGGKIILGNAKGTITYIMPNGSIIIEQWGQVVAWLAL
jgi:RHS repeat-associated protein